MQPIERKIENAIRKSYNDDTKRLTSILIDLHETNKRGWFLSTDWHLWIKDRKATVNGFHPVYCRENCNDILHQYEDISKLFFLGDLVDDEFYYQFTPEEQDAIFGEMFDGIRKNLKYLILGNNDKLQHKSLYEKYGFEVVDALLVNGKYLLTHIPINMTNINGITNIHGHQHGHNFYWTVPYRGHLDIWNKDRTPVLFESDNIKNMTDKYSKQITDISEMRLKSKEEFVRYRGTYKTEDEI